MNTYPVIVRQTEQMELVFTFLDDEDVVVGIDRLQDAPDSARSFIAEATGEAPSDIALAIQMSVVAPNRLRNVHSQLKLRHYLVGPIEWINDVWSFGIEGGPEPIGPKAAGVMISDLGEGEPDRDLWVPKYIGWATTRGNYTGEMTFSPAELADRILNTIATDDVGRSVG